MEIDIAEISTTLVKQADGIWVSTSSSSYSYPDEGNSLVFPAEDNLFWFRHRNKCIVEAVNAFPAQGPIFDIGGGNGVVSLALKNAGYQSILVEPGKHGIQNAQSRGLNPLISSTMEDANFKENSLPAVGMFDVLEHIENDIEFLSYIHTRLKKDGKIYLSVPAYSQMWSHEDVFANHYRRYTIRLLADVLNASGFTVDYATYMFSFLPFPLFLMRTLPYRLKLDKWLSPDRNKAAKTNLGILGSTLESAFSFELSAIRKGKSIPFGGSGLVAATRR
ncbi:MAG: class I SAM-dependent methyltransferase [Chloroflexota bacterium]